MNGWGPPGPPGKDDFVFGLERGGSPARFDPRRTRRRAWLRRLVLFLRRLPINLRSDWDATKIEWLP